MAVKESIGNLTTGIKERLFGKSHLPKGDLVDLDFVAMVGPQNGINFSHEKYIETGDGYIGCIYVYGYPKEVSAHWLRDITSIDNTISVIDIATPNINEVKRNLTRSMEEQESRMASAKTNAQRLDAAKQLAEQEAMYQEVAQYGNTMKTICARIFVPAGTLADVDKRVANIIDSLGRYKLGIYLNETKQDWQASMEPYDTQQASALYAKRGKEMLASTFALGNPFHFTKLDDPNGVYYGSTKTGGSVFLDEFKVDSRRMSYNSIIVGMMGSGKSTLLKKELMERAARGDKVRVFDVTGEFRAITEFLGGKIIHLDGENGRGDSIINALQILESGDSPMISYNKHIAKVATIYKYLKPEAEPNEVLVLKTLLRLLYIKWGLVSEAGRINQDVKTLTPEDFPTWSDFRAFIKQGLDYREGLVDHINMEDAQEEDRQEDIHVDLSKIRDSGMEYIESIELVVEDLCSSYGNIFNGHTSIQSFHDEQIVCFDIKNLAGLEANIFDAQLFAAFSLCWDDCVESGRRMKSLWETKQIAWEDITRFKILIDEAHHMINANKLAGVEQIASFLREARKFFGGITLASQSIRDFVPDGSSSTAETQMKIIFELCSYKWVMNQDSNSKAKIRTVFEDSFTESEVEDVSKLTKGEVMLAIPGESTVRFNINIAEIPEEVLQGGA